MAILYLKCPEPGGDIAADFDGSLLVDLAGFADFLGRAGVDRSFGLELRAAYHFEYRTERPRQRHDQPLRKFFLRPAIEPILYSYASDLRPGAAGHRIVDKFVSSSMGSLCLLRDGEARSGVDDEGNYAIFPEPGHATAYLDRLTANLPQITHPISKAAYAFGEAILSHPYPDGNARLGRGLALLCLADAMQVETMPLPLGPVLTVHNDRYVAALQNLSATGNWADFIGDFHFFLSEALAVSDVLLDWK